jgi:hypothetical protein
MAMDGASLGLGSKIMAPNRAVVSLHLLRELIFMRTIFFAPAAPRPQLRFTDSLARGLAGASDQPEKANHEQR